MKQCSHLEESVNDLNEIANILTARECWSELKCSDCDCHGPNLWLCLKKNCSHIGCAEKSNDHSTIHNAMDSTHCIHMNLSTRRVWCYKCKGEVFLGSNGMVNTTVYENNQDEKDTSSNKDTNHGSYSPLRANSPDRGTIFEDSVGLNVGMSGEGDASDSSDVGESIDYNSTTSNGGLVGLQNIGNTCYMNAALQALSNTEPLTKYFLDCGQIVHWLSEGKKPGLSRTFQALLRDMWLKKTSQSFVNPSGILYGIRNVYAMFRGYHQHDTQEFLRNFMDQLHEELKQPVAAECGGPAGEGDTFSLAIEEPPALSYDSSEGEYETCDSGVSERSSLSDDSETRPGTETAVSGGKRRLSECQSPARRQRPRVVASPVIDAQPQSTSARKPVKYRSIISDIFDGKLLSSVQCLTCDRVSSRVETFQDLSLPIPSKDHLVLLHGRASVPSATCTDAVAAPAQDGWLSWLLAWLRSWWYGPAVTLHDCLAAFFSTDELKGDNMYSCERCNKLRNGIKYSKVLQLPEVLCVHLKRFRHELMYSSKIAAAVSFPLRDLDMWPYLQDDPPPPKVPSSACDRDTTKPSTYDLFSVICHHGTAGGGHYTSFALNGGQWYEFDDQYVTRVSAERVQNCEAYVLFYRKSQAAAEGVRRQASRLADEGAPKARLSRQWLARFRHCAEPGPIDNSDFLCRHGALDPDKEPLLERLAVRVPLEMYEYLQERFGGSAPPEDSACPACTALQHRVLREMEQFLEVSREAQAKRPPHTHYLSTGWYLRWLAFVQRKVADPPGPIDNGASEEEKADVPETVWRFFHGIYGGGPELRVPPREADREGESDGEERPERGPAQECTEAMESEGGGDTAEAGRDEGQAEEPRRRSGGRYRRRHR